MKKTGLEKMRDCLDEMYKKGLELRGELTPIKDLLFILKSLSDTVRGFIAEEEQVQKPPADEGLVEEKKRFCRYTIVDDTAESCAYQQALTDIMQAVCHHTPVKQEAIEPLAVLADRKECYIMGTYSEKDKDLKDQFRIHFKSRSPFFIGKTYAEAEAKARAWLESLPDKGE